IYGIESTGSIKVLPQCRVGSVDSTFVPRWHQTVTLAPRKQHPREEVRMKQIPVIARQHSEFAVTIGFRRRTAKYRCQRQTQCLGDMSPPTYKTFHAGHS